MCRGSREDSPSGRLFPCERLDSPSPNSCRFHRGVSDVSFCTSVDHGDDDGDGAGLGDGDDVEASSHAKEER